MMEEEPSISVKVTPKELHVLERYRQKVRLKEVDAVLVMIGKQDSKEKAPSSVGVSDRLPSWKERRVKEDAEELEEQRRWDALSDEQQIVEILKLIDETPQS
jgi:multidrug efflux pump subunit AcrB